MIKPNSAFFGSMQVRKNAKRIMCERGNLLRLIGASFILIAVSDVLIYLFEAVCYFFFDKMPTPLFAAELLVLFFVISPLMAAIARMAFRMCLHETTDISDIMYYFKRERMRDTYFLSLFVLGELLLQFGFSFAFGRLFAYAFEGIHSDLFSPMTMALTFFFMPILSGLFPKTLTVPNAFFRTEKLGEAFSLPAGDSRGQAKEVMLFNISFVPLLLLSLLTLGILFFVYLLPLYMISAQLFASHLAETNIKNM